MKQFNAEIYKEEYVIYKQNPEPAMPEILYYREEHKPNELYVIWMGTCIKDGTKFDNLDDVVEAYINVCQTTNEKINVMLISTILSTVPTEKFKNNMHNKIVADILDKFDPSEIKYLKTHGILK